MTTAITYRFELDKTSKKWPCPQCRQKRFVRCRDIDLNEYLPDHVGRCDRENGCGYEYTWKKYVEEKKAGSVPFIQNTPAEVEKPVDFLPTDLAGKTIDSSYYYKNNLFLFLCSLFGKRVAIDVCRKYLIGTSNYWKGAHVYWQVDEKQNFRQCKIMLCDARTGKRKKEGAEVYRWNRETNAYIFETTERPCSLVYGKFLTEATKGLNLRQCFFGEHLLAEYPDKPVCIVESEKTALIASVYLPQFNWLATGGASGCKWRDYAVYKVLQWRSATFFPDHGYFNLKTAKTCFEEWSERCEHIADALPGTKLRVSDVLEKRLANKERQDEDLADMLLIKDEPTGLALTESGYPVMWDYKI